MTFALRSTPRSRVVSLTPMVDVVFLLLVFFMLAARFEQDVGVEFAAPGVAGGADVPRLVDVLPEGLRLNGVDLGLPEATATLDRLGAASDVVVLRPANGVDVQRLIDVAESLRDAGFVNLAIVE